MTRKWSEVNDAYIAIKETINILATVGNENNKAQKNFTFKNNAPLRSCISKIGNTLLDNGEVLDAVMPVYNLLEYSENYSVKSGSLWNCYRDEIDGVDDNASQGKSFEYKTKIIRKTPDQPPQLEDEGDTDRPARPPVPPLNVEINLHSSILVIFADRLIYL